jgi:hypothetical protein
MHHQYSIHIKHQPTVTVDCHQELPPATCLVILAKVFIILVKQPEVTINETRRTSARHHEIEDQRCLFRGQDSSGGSTQEHLSLNKEEEDCVTPLEFGEVKKTR